MSDKYVFLTDDWIEAARVIRDEAGGGGALPHAVKMNLIVIEAPDNPDFVDGRFEGHMDSSGGEMRMDKGHLDDPDLTVTVDYETARAIFVDQNPQAGMQAFMSGKIKIDGDMTKMMAMQNATPDPSAVDIANKIKDITA